MPLDPSLLVPVAFTSFLLLLSKQASQYAIEASALQSGSPLFSNTEHGKLNGSLRIALLYFVSLIQDEGPLWL